MVMKAAQAFRHHMLLRYVQSVSFFLLVGAVVGNASAKDKHPNARQDQIQVVAHIPAMGDGSIVDFLTTQHYSRNYLYAEHQSRKTVTLIDITDVSHPTVLADMSDPAGASDNFVAVTGNAALVASANQPASLSPSAQTFRILSFADPIHPTVQQEFHDVTAVARDDRRELIFLANADGIWILQRQFAPDPQAEKEWEHMMLDAR